MRHEHAEAIFLDQESTVTPSHNFRYPQGSVSGFQLYRVTGNALRAGEHKYWQIEDPKPFPCIDHYESWSLLLLALGIQSNPFTKALGRHTRKKDCQLFLVRSLNLYPSILHKKTSNFSR